MATASVRLFDCTPDDVFAVLGDGWVYPSWVVGASRMRAVDPEWPAEGSHIHHSLGAWPVLIDDDTQVVEWSPPRRIRLRGKAGPFGRVIIVIEVKPRGDGCIVRLAEEPVGGAARIPRFLWAPLLHLRNEETIQRLRFLAEGRRRERDAAQPTARPSVPTPEAGAVDADAVADAAEATDATEAGAGRA
ncbi:polyketide cyclase/dehydrase/lipid transport protein [Microbacterium sp. AG790]|uniref:SRPBCC family protein n=1 Tax=Microbacterium sp. AG790 TaxID=2183995 RepID=UPI000EAB6D11|nr:SRPBCC family protein [Microbacterium sp. AG790]RKS90184.1 polyketide cyclase/dehydrase/lipid transport protein [Microbacterium sp. AG790]